MPIPRLILMVCVYSAVITGLGCQQEDGGKRVRSDLGDVLFVSEDEGKEETVLVFPARNGTGTVSHPYRSYYLGLRILSVEADGKPIPAEPCIIEFYRMETRRMEIKADEIFAYTFRLLDDHLIYAQEIADENIVDMWYTIPPYSRLKVRYAVRDGTPDGILYEGVAIFANRVLTGSTADRAGGASGQ